MRRKIIQQRDSYTVTLPKQWVTQSILSSGSEIDISETSQGNLIIKSASDKPKVINKQELNIDGMSSYQITRLIRGYYRSSTEQIKLIYSNHEIPNFRSKSTILIDDLCIELCSKLIGLEIIDSSNNSIILQCFISQEDIANTLIIKRRIFLLVKEFMKDILNSIDDFDKIFDLHYVYHDNIAKLCDYYMRIIIYRDISSSEKTRDYALISLVDKVVDKLRYLCEEIHDAPKITNKIKIYLEKIFILFDMYYELIYLMKKFNPTDVIKYRYNLVSEIKSEKFTLSEYKVLSEVFLILHIINDVFEFGRITMHHT